MGILAIIPLYPFLPTGPGSVGRALGSGKRSIYRANEDNRRLLPSLSFVQLRSVPFSASGESFDALWSMDTAHPSGASFASASDLEGTSPSLRLPHTLTTYEHPYQPSYLRHRRVGQAAAAPQALGPSPVPLQTQASPWPNQEGIQPPPPPSMMGLDPPADNP